MNSFKIYLWVKLCFFMPAVIKDQVWEKDITVVITQGSQDSRTVQQKIRLPGCNMIKGVKENNLKDSS